MNLSAQQRENYIAFAKTIAIDAGNIIESNFGLGMAKEWKDDNTPVTATDVAINNMVISKIREKYPTHSVQGEELSHKTDSNYTWVCDPVDGTVPFAHGLPISTFSLALVVDGRSEVAVVYDPYQNRLFEATMNGGAFMNGKKLQVKTCQKLESALIDVVPNVGSLTVVNMDSIEEKLRAKNSLVTNLWSVILPTALVAAGEYTATIFNCSKPEDAAAVGLIVKEAGGVFTDLYGEQQRYDRPITGFVASNGTVHDEVLAIIKEAIKSNENTRS